MIFIELKPNQRARVFVNVSLISLPFFLIVVVNSVLFWPLSLSFSLFLSFCSIHSNLLDLYSQLCSFHVSATNKLR